MGIWNSLQNSIHNFFDFQKKLKKFKRTLAKSDASFKTLYETIGDKLSKVESFYNELVNEYPKKYIKEKEKYKQLIANAVDYDNRIIELDKILDEFSYTNVINNPESYSADSFSKYNSSLSFISSFKNKAEKYELLFNQVLELKEKIELIKEQFRLIPVYEDATRFDEDSYFDEDVRQNILSKIKPIIEAIDKAGKQYYNFDNVFNIQNLIDDHNREYIESHLNDPIFDNVCGRSMDCEQRTSALSDEKSALTIAGAGSGKTLTICGKVKYLLEHNNVKPNDILLLSYSKESANDLNEKVSKINDGLTVETFHKLGLDILKEVNGQVLTVEEQYNAIIEEYFREEIKNRPNVMEKVLYYFALYLNPNRKNKKFQDEGELFDDLKKTDNRTLKTILCEMSGDESKRETIKKEHVKSFEEMAIANFYFINGIDYVYEAPYCVNLATKEKRQYTPDFYLKKYNIYHEHYGIAKDGIPHQFEGEQAQKYVDSIQWKRKTHQENHTICIETFSYEFDDGLIFPKLEKELKSRGAEFKKLSSKEIANALNSIYEGQNFKSFINLIKSFLSLYKARYKDASYFENLRKSKFKNSYERIRANLFLDIVQDVYCFYKNYLKNEQKIDFDDMILKSTEAMERINSFKYKYVIVDEFQDISFSRMQFLKKLISKGNSKLYAVGDDWQAIYRFSGCDLDIFLNFEEYFGRSAISYITSTHRNSQELQDIAGPFIKANPEQYNKDIKSDKHLQKPIKISYYVNDKFSALMEVFNSIYNINRCANVLILGRNNHDIDDYLNTHFFFDKRNKGDGLRTLFCDKYKSFNISYTTVHSSKGLEDEFVIIINADDSKLGFPNKIEDDEILNLVLSAKSNYEFAEERRLWYVALTRTKTYTYIIANKESPSIFVKEILDSCDVISDESPFRSSSSISCPYCKSGRLVMRTREADGNRFYGCSNYPYCKYTIDDFKAVERNLRCPDCGDFMIERYGRYGSFYGCHGYPKCDYKENS